MEVYNGVAGVLARIGVGVYWVTMDPRVQMAFLISSTLAAENLNTGETDACCGNWSFSRVSFLACT